MPVYSTPWVSNEEFFLKILKATALKIYLIFLSILAILGTKKALSAFYRQKCHLSLKINVFGHIHHDQFYSDAYRNFLF